MSAHLFERETYEQKETRVDGSKLPILLGVVLFFALVTFLFIAPNVLKYLDPGSGSFLIQLLIGGASSCAICGIPIAIIGAVIYFFTKNRRKQTQSDSTNESDS
jgi:hypothetical protein